MNAGPAGNRVVLVTGASRGIGKQVALRLGGADHIVVSSHSVDRAEPVAEEIRAAGGSASVTAADLLDQQQVADLVHAVVKEHGRLDHLVASGAGGSPEGLHFKLFNEMDPDSFIGLARAHWLSKAYLIKAALDHMIPTGYGKIVSISSDGGRVPTPNESMLGGAAAALLMMSRVIARETGRYGIRINTITVGPLADFDMTRIVTSDQSTPGATSGRLAENLQKRVLFPATSADVAEMVKYLFSEAGDTITGQTWSVNGGVSTF